jgi:hypothetical protein
MVKPPLKNPAIHSTIVAQVLVVPVLTSVEEIT